MSKKCRGGYKKRCMIMACKKKAMEENNGIYFCREHKSIKLKAGEEYTLKDGSTIKFYEPKDDN